MKDDMIHMQSGVSVFTGEPYIELTWGNQKGQLTPKEVRAHAFALLECADAALSDAFLFNFIKTKVHADEEQAAQVLLAFREFRDGRQPPPGIPKDEQ